MTDEIDPSTVDLGGLIAGGEGQHLEFKAALVDPEATARTLAGLANSGGGTLVVGVADDARVVGVRDTASIEGTIRQAGDLIDVPAQMTQVKDGRKTVVVAKVPAVAELVVAPDGGVATRDESGKRVAADITKPKPANSSDLSAVVEQLNQLVQPLNQQIVEMSAKFDRAREEDKRGRKFRWRVLDWVGAGVIGALLAVLAGALHLG